MITVFSFLFGTVVMVLGFSMLWKTTLFVQWFGDLEDLFGSPNMRFLSWKFMGVILFVLGFMFAFGIWGLVWQMTLGRLFNFGGL